MARFVSMCDVDVVVSIVVHGRSNVPSSMAMRAPSAVALSFVDIDDCFCAQGGEGGGVEVEVSKKLHVG